MPNGGASGTVSPPMTVTGVALLLHVFAAMAFVSGYVGTNVMTEVARRARTIDERRAALSASGVFDRMLNQRGGTAVIVTAPIVVWAYGYPVTTPWLVASTVMFLTIPILGGLYWARVGRRLDDALARGDDEQAVTLLNHPRTVLVSRLENLLVLAIIALMVLRPG
jgi:hypothetical protein